VKTVELTGMGATMRLLSKSRRSRDWRERERDDGGGDDGGEEKAVGSVQNFYIYQT
jgi:hypothetical protein